LRTRTGVPPWAVTTARSMSAGPWR
jgi:hypothetical protein